MALIGEMQYLTIGGNTYSLPVGGGGTVTSIAVSNATNGGLSISGSPISSSGTITIGHSNVLAAAQTTQAVYPITIDKNGHINGYGTAIDLEEMKIFLVTITGVEAPFVSDKTAEEIYEAYTNGRMVLLTNPNDSFLIPLTYIEHEEDYWYADFSLTSVFSGVTTVTTGTFGATIETVNNTTTVEYVRLQNEIAFKNHTHGNITNDGDITTTATIASGDRLVINDESASKVNNSSITFGTSTSQYLANNGTWQNVPSGTSVTNNYYAGAIEGKLMLYNSTSSSSTVSSTTTSNALKFSSTGGLQVGSTSMSDGVKGSIILSNSAMSTGTTTITPSGSQNRTIALPNATGTVALTSDILQSDWNQTTSTAKDYIKNKPTIPTKVSDLTNDSGFITGYTETDPTVPSWAKASSKPSYNFSEIGSIPTSISGYGITDAYTKSEVDGLVSGVLHYKGTKATVSALPSSGNIIGDVWHVTADGSEWAWDGTTWQELGTAVDLSGYVPTSRTINSKALTGNISLTASDVGALPSSTTIPSKTSDLTNDSGFINSIKTINNQSLLGSGNITVSTTAAQIIRWTEST